MISKPQDIAIMFGLFAMAIVLVGIGVAEINNDGASVDNTFFRNVVSNVNSTEGLHGASTGSSGALSGADESSDKDSEANILVKGFYSMLKLGKTWGIMEESLTDVQHTLGIDPLFLTIIIAIITISFAVVIYTWIRGN